MKQFGSICRRRNRVIVAADSTVDACRIGSYYLAAERSFAPRPSGIMHIGVSDAVLHNALHEITLSLEETQFNQSLTSLCFESSRPHQLSEKATLALRNCRVEELLEFVNKFEAVFRPLGGTST
jgi:hypothetical protein